MAKQKTPGSEQAAAINWFASQPRAIQLEAIRLQTDLVRQSRQPGTRPSPEFLLDHLVEACRKMRHEEDSLRLKAKLSQSGAKRVHEHKMARFLASRSKPKSSPKREAIRLKYFHMVQGLRREGSFGWRNCASYLKEQYKFDVTHTYLKQVIEDLERLENGD